MATSQGEIADVIEHFIRREFRIIEDGASFREAHLFESGYVDSAGVVELIAFLESRFGINLDDEHVFSEQFTTIDGVAAIVTAVMARDRRYDGIRAAAV
jgi:acyl carrier protein